MHNVVSPEDSHWFSHGEIERAVKICETYSELVRGRGTLLEGEDIDKGFALPDGNWSPSSPNEFIRLFQRMAHGSRSDLQNLRALCQVFSGYNLYLVKDAKGIQSSRIVFDANTSESVAENMRERNGRYVDEWQKMVCGLPIQYIFRPPTMFGESGHFVAGTIVNHDTVTYQERINLIYMSGIGERLERIAKERREIRICEIGGGYGALAHWCLQAFPECSYTIIDLPESLLFSRLYLSLANPGVATVDGLAPIGRGLRFVPNYLAQDLNESFDLVINTLSMSEMTAYQVETYVDLMKRVWLADGGVFFEQNQDNTHMGLIFAEDIFKERFANRKSLSIDGASYRNGRPNVFSESSINLQSRHLPEYPVLRTSLEDIGEFNLVQSGRNYFCLRKSFGPVDVRNLAPEDAPPDIYHGTSPEEAVAKVG